MPFPARAGVFPASVPASLRHWVSNLYLLHRSPILLVIVLVAITAVAVRGLRWRIGAAILVAAASGLAVLAGWAALSLVPIAMRIGPKRHRRRNNVVGFILVWILGVAGWTWGHPSLSHRVAGYRVPIIVAAVLILAVIAGAKLWPHMGSRWHATGKNRFATAAQAAQVLAAWNNKCAACGASGDAPGVSLEIDHIVPYAMGGPTEVNNLQPLCGPCNRAKGTLSMDQFLKTPYFRSLR